MNNNKQQTAVEWLMDRLPHSIETQFSKQIEQAKEMEKQQIIDAHLTGLIHPLEMEATKQAEQYYNETFKSE
jgi:vacuolar-type H+-ATPase subunit H